MLPKSVKLDGLPENVVPLTRSASLAGMHITDDESMSIFEGLKFWCYQILRRLIQVAGEDTARQSSGSQQL